MRSTFVAIAMSALLVATMATTALAGGAVRNPSAMILRQADLPGATYEAEADLDDYLRKPLQAAGLSGKAAQYLGVTFSQRKGSLKVSGVVLTVSSAAEARRVFTITKKARDAFLRSAGVRGWTTVSVPSYGNQQRARVSPPGNEGIAIAELIVRKNTAVWLLYVVLERRPKPPVSEVVSDLKRFAAKQQRRVGAG
ncbi:MAG TPA: hypothetical protein VMK83_10880 [Gaiellaceae bacterium]|nr:hypothetical protein [Gaiellaceae bacterium]